MPLLSYVRALNRALSVEMERDPAVCVFGEDIGIAARAEIAAAAGAKAPA